MIQGRYQALAASVFIHLILVAILLFAPNHTTPPVAEQRIENIKSYLYQPKQPAPLEVKTSVDNKQKNTSLQSTPIEVTESPKIEPLIQNNTQPSNLSTAMQQEEAITPSLPDKKVITSTTSDKVIGIKEKALQQLTQLNSKLTQRAITNEVEEHFRHRSPSVMHAEPTLVPKSVVPLTTDQQQALNTQALDGSLAITKGDDGKCTIEEDLSKIGMEGVKAYSSFACGESKFDKSFRLHMEKVRKKLTN